MVVTAIVLAGRRGGVLDPLAAAAGVPLKCLVPVGGKPLIDHVLTALLASAPITSVRVVVDEVDLLRAHIARNFPVPAVPIDVIPAAQNLVDSILAGAAGAAYPLLITTADNVMLTPRSVEEFIAGASADKGGVALAMARREAVMAAHPQGQRRFYRFSDGEFSNCNTYWIGTESALSGAETFRSGGQFIKYPSRIARTFGLWNLLKFYFGLGRVQACFDGLGRRLGFPVRMVELSDGAMAIDVDNERSHRVTGQLLEQRNTATLAG
ncbi:NTP transferase domain-containing protein [Allopontixanthobacter sp.]|uniref:NTP transferase domain-containing protein n=1 Tax=Allopontixanthobacter sp. TaxID=2906452 RepID=UPI002AB891D9|nr:NTP transferase domain-containing protein [Allopontixanthobacter sp.]MDZ4306670.1 NTP transferase domain-containing protein [Allopontixanthobacter sp.]